MRPFILAASLLCLASSAYSQAKLSSEVKNKLTIVSASIENVEAMFNAPMVDWENQVKALNYSNRMMKTACTEFSKGSDQQGSSHIVSKCPDKISIMWNHAKFPDIKVLDSLVAKLTPYYVGNEKENMVYNVTRNGFEYKFIIYRAKANTTEWLTVYRKQL